LLRAACVSRCARAPHIHVYLPTSPLAPKPFAMSLPTILPEQLCDAAQLAGVTCAICHEIYCEPKCGPCGHFLCGGCWRPSLKSSHNKCPLCREPVDKVAWNQGMHLHMSSLVIRCAHKGCHWKGPLQDYEGHLRDCPARLLKEARAQDELELWLPIADADAEVADLKMQLEQCHRAPACAK